MNITNTTPYINPQEDREEYKRSDEESDLEERSRGLIDKIEFYLAEPLRFTDLENLAEGEGLTVKRHKLSGAGWSFSITDESNQRISFFMFGRHGTSSKRAFVRPDDFESYDKMQVFLYRVIGRNHFECAEIYRTDFAVDIPDHFENLKRFVYSRRKKFCRVFLNDGYRVSGIQIGRQPEVISMYDKALESKVPGPLTRIEIQMRSSAKAVENFSQLPRLIDLVDGSYIHFFRKVDMEGSIFTDPNKIESRDKLIALIRAMTLSEEVGTHLARRKCNNGLDGFEYSDFVQCYPYPVDINRVLMRDLCYFFGKPQRAKVLNEFWPDDE